MTLRFPPLPKYIPIRRPVAATILVVLLAALAMLAPLAFAQSSPHSFSLRQVLGYTHPSHLVASQHGNRFAWVMNVHGVRNIWLAQAPEFQPRKLTRYTKDDGLELIDLTFSPDGRYLIYVRGGDEDAGWSAPNRRQPNPSSTPHQVDRQLWSIDTAGPHAPKLLSLHARNPVVSPDGKQVVYEQILEQQLWTVPIDGSRPAKQMFWNRGSISDSHWSPDGKSLAFVTSRDSHSFIGIYRGPNQPIEYLDPKTSYDSSPRWSPDGKQIAFIRRPGSSPYMPIESLKRTPDPWSIWLADAATGKAVEVWKSPDTLLGSFPSWGEPGRANLNWLAGGRLAFIASLDGWWHVYSVKAAAHAAPKLLTPGHFMVKYMRVAPDRKTIFYDANTGPSKLDVDRRHLFSVDVDTSKIKSITSGDGIEWDPTPASGGRYVAYFNSTARRPPLVGIVDTGTRKIDELQRNLIPPTSRNPPSSFPGRYLCLPPTG